MTTLETLASGIPVVIPSGVGLHDELPEVVAGSDRHVLPTAAGNIIAVEVDGVWVFQSDWVIREAPRMTR